MRPLAIVALLLLVAATATAAVTRSFRQTTAKDFEEGEATASMVLPTGDVVPGMKSSSIALDAAFVWCGALSPDGKTAYFGTGDQGRIYAVDTGATGGKARLLATLEAAWVTALAVRPDGTLIAGTTPGKLTWDGALAVRIVTWVAFPLLSVAAVQYPELANQAFAFLEPFTRALH